MNINMQKLAYQQRSLRAFPQAPEWAHPAGPSNTWSGDWDRDGDTPRPFRHSGADSYGRSWQHPAHPAHSAPSTSAVKAYAYTLSRELVRLERDSLLS